MSAKTAIFDLVRKVEARGYHVTSASRFINAVVNTKALTNEATFEADLETLFINGIIKEATHA